jgi:hypothetical protein
MARHLDQTPIARRRDHFDSCISIPAFRFLHFDSCISIPVAPAINMQRHRHATMNTPRETQALKATYPAVDRGALLSLH